jgi:hypothetical protein
MLTLLTGVANVVNGNSAALASSPQAAEGLEIEDVRIVADPVP